uniref:Uncharacterized protein n=1 Tax=Plectus sambesii TaxID=2011161 RepID=A0A914X424_9BILA
MIEPKAKRPKVFVDDWDDDLQLSQADLDAIDRIPMTGAGTASTVAKARPIENMRKDARFSAAGLDATDILCAFSHNDTRLLQQSSAFDDSFRPTDSSKELEELKKKLRSVTGERNILRNRIADHEVSKRALEMQIQKLEYSKKEVESTAKMSLEQLEKQKLDEIRFKDQEIERERERWKRERTELTMLNDSQLSTVSQSQVPTTPSSIVRTRKVVVTSASKSTFGPDHGSFFSSSSTSRFRPVRAPFSTPSQRVPFSVASQRVPSDDVVESSIVVDQNRPSTIPTVESSVQTDALPSPVDSPQVHRAPQRGCVITEYLMERQLMKLMEISLNNDSITTSDSPSDSDEEEPFHLRNIMERIIGGDSLSELLVNLQSVDSEQK